MLLFVAILVASKLTDSVTTLTLLRYDQCGNQASPDGKGRHDEFELFLDNNSNGNDQVKEGGRTQGDIVSSSRIMQWWWGNQNHNGSMSLNGKENPLDVFTPRTKRRRKRELGWGTGSSSSSNDEMEHDEGRNRNTIQQHLDQMKYRHIKQRGSQVSIPDKHSSLMCISEG